MAIMANSVPYASDGDHGELRPLRLPGYAFAPHYLDLAIWGYMAVDPGVSPTFGNQGDTTGAAVQAAVVRKWVSSLPRGASIMTRTT